MILSNHDWGVIFRSCLSHQRLGLLTNLHKSLFILLLVDMSVEFIIGVLIKVVTQQSGWNGGDILSFIVSVHGNTFLELAKLIELNRFILCYSELRMLI